MSNSKSKSVNVELDQILNFVDSSRGLLVRISESGRIQIQQDIDGKSFSFSSSDLSEVIHRTDIEGKHFLQINFKSDVKVLLTETLIGFKPTEVLGLDMTRLPKVVTTPDITSVYEAIEEALGGDPGMEAELEILKKVYLAVVSGAERVGFDLMPERKWLNRLLISKHKAFA